MSLQKQKKCALKSLWNCASIRQSYPKSIFGMTIFGCAAKILYMSSGFSVSLQYCVLIGQFCTVTTWLVAFPCCRRWRRRPRALQPGCSLASCWSAGTGDACWPEVEALAYGAAAPSDQNTWLLASKQITGNIRLQS